MFLKVQKIFVQLRDLWYSGSLAIFNPPDIKVKRHPGHIIVPGVCGNLPVFLMTIEQSTFNPKLVLCRGGNAILVTTPRHIHR